MPPDSPGSQTPSAEDAVDHVDGQLFAQSIGSLRSHTSRKEALSDETRYAILYLLYEYGEMTQKRLLESLNEERAGLETHVRPLLDTNIIARVPGPTKARDQLTYYRITTLGRQEIEADIRHIQDSSTASRLFNHRDDPDIPNTDTIIPSEERIESGPEDE